MAFSTDGRSLPFRTQAGWRAIFSPRVPSYLTVSQVSL
jgi:hypothetical protein